MSFVSYPRAIGACAPVLGPFIGLYNNIQTDRELKCLSENHDVSGASRTLHTAIPNLSAEGVRAERLLVHQRGRIYAICALAGSVMTVVLVILALVYGILSTSDMVRDVFLGGGVLVSCLVFPVVGGSMQLLALRKHLNEISRMKQESQLLAL